MRWRYILFLIVLGFLIFIPGGKAQAVGGTCVQKKDVSCPAGLPYERAYTLTDYGSATCHTEDAQARGITGNGTYNVCCATPDEVNSVFSLKAPLCGSADELGKANSSCWQCGGTLRCSGADPNLALGAMSPELLQGKQPIHEGDGVDNVWKVSSTQFGTQTNFTFNGQSYPVPQGDIIVCNANDAGCGASDTGCTNVRFSEYTTDTKGDSFFEGQKIAGSGGKKMYILGNPGLNVGQAITTPIGLNFLGKIIDVRDIFARIRYGFNQAGDSIFESFPDLRRFGSILEKVASEDLLPSKFTKELVPPDYGDKARRYPLKGMAGYRLCAPGGEIADTGKDNIPLRGVTVTSGNIGFSDPINPRAWPQILWSSQYLASLFTRAKTLGFDFYIPNGDMVPLTRTPEGEHDAFYDVSPEILDPILFKCDANSEGAPLTRTNTKAEGEARIGGPGGVIASIAAKFFRQFFSLHPCDENDTEGNCAEGTLKIVATDSIAGDLAGNSNVEGISLDQLNPNMSLADRCKIIEDGGGSCNADNPEGQKGGFVRRFIPAQYVKNIKTPNAKTPQRQAFSFTQNSGLAPQFRDAYPLWLKGMIDSLSCVIDSAVVSSPLQKLRGNPRCVITQGEEDHTTTPDRPLAIWAGKDQTLNPDFKIPDIHQDVKKAIEEASNNQIPACVLEAVKYIETGPSWTNGGECKINECSAAGPFQITVGYVSDGAGGWTKQCDQCGDGKACPDGWNTDWPNTPGDASPCDDIGATAQRAVEMLQDKAAFWTQYWTGKYFDSQKSLEPGDPAPQKDVIIVAGNSYYGSGKPIGRLDNCSYGEFVYRHCDPSYTCTGSGKFLFPQEEK